MKLPRFVRRFFTKEDPQTGLICYTVVTKEGSYGGKFLKAIKVDGPKEFYEEYLFKQNADHRLRLITATRWENKHFPMVDVDNERDFLAAQAFLCSSDIDYALWESSPGRYWFLVDRWFSSGKDAVNFARSVPGCDEDYCNAANYCGFCAMRLSSKGKFVLPPRLIKNPKNEKLQEFCTALKTFLQEKQKEFRRLDFHRALFHKSVSMAAPGEIGIKKQDRAATIGDLISFNGCLRVVHVDDYNSSIREELGSDLLEGIVLSVDVQAGTRYYVVFVDEDPKNFGSRSSAIKDDERFKILTPFYVAADHVVQNKGNEVEVLLTHKDYHRRHLASWLAHV